MELYVIAVCDDTSISDNSVWRPQNNKNYSSSTESKKRWKCYTFQKPSAEIKVTITCFKVKW